MNKQETLEQVMNDLSDAVSKSMDQLAEKVIKRMKKEAIKPKDAVRFRKMLKRAENTDIKNSEKTSKALKVLLKIDERLHDNLQSH